MRTRRRNPVPDFLFELGIEEIPVSEIKNMADQLKDFFTDRLNEQGIRFKSLESGATNRRFMVHISGLDEKAQDKEEQILGPPKNIAFDKKGKPTIALKKFLESHQADSSGLIEIETKKGIYTGMIEKTEGDKTAHILSTLIPGILQSLSFSTTMVWNESRVPFIRPIKNILALYDSKLIDFQFAGIQTSNFIQGHSLLSPEPLNINSFRDYIIQINKNFVIVKPEERKEKILSEVKDITDELDVKIQMDADLLDNYIYNNEYPVVFLGEFDPKYLELPSEIISTFMIREKKLHPVMDKNNKLLNIFIGVSNIPDENKNVVHGNERVIQATLEDAKFFWDQDRKDDFLSLREKLKNVVFQKDLGTFYEKTERLEKLVEFLAEITGHTGLAKSLKEAARYCKNDLVTRMVREFPSLQGIMGGLYLNETKSDENIWKSIYGHYRPKGYSDERLDHPGAALLSMADKMDNITGFIQKGIKISSSKDPYGIRRDANAIIKIIIDFKMDFDLNVLIGYGAEEFCNYFSMKDNTDELRANIKDFFINRVENIFRDVFHIGTDLLQAIMTDDSLHIHNLYLRSRDVSTMKETESIEHLVILHKRLKNIIKDYEPYAFSEKLLTEKEEKILFEIFKESKAKIEEFIMNHQYIQACSTFLEMKPIIDNFFDKILVIAKDEKIRNNRLALLQRINELLSKVADFSLIVE
jgi:glycyl-tRNA synthetase beta chain